MNKYHNLINFINKLDCGDIKIQIMDKTVNLNFSPANNKLEFFKGKYVLPLLEKDKVIKLNEAEKEILKDYSDICDTFKEILIIHAFFVKTMEIVTEQLERNKIVDEDGKAPTMLFKEQRDILADCYGKIKTLNEYYEK